MPLKTRIQELKAQLPKEHQELSHYVEHALQALENFETEHRRFAAAQAVAGVRISGAEEIVFYDTIAKIKEELVNTLHKTVEDYVHKGDKNWNKNFKDGID
ncbi:hypothetical protein [Paenibacillus sp. Leaf72]|uniref:hypothetical protein n=1 Tax=Paenibacillus sp. Leaf72 TaxID=1736234 RepID=UPI0006F3633D|nr:hypothetical protein [Paenibacillus sp. Leaf72]KQO18515.1 hypothetical protein ASF12_07905 [Paenibacillus sp. Leaf72]